MRFKSRLEGMDELVNKMKALTDDAKIHGKLVKDPLLAAADVAHKAIDPHIPVDSGALKASHSISKVVRRRGEWIVTDGVSSPGGDKALAQEFGNATTRAQPFILPGFQQSAPRAIEAFRSGLEQNLKDFARTGKTTSQLQRAEVRKAAVAQRRARAKAISTTKSRIAAGQKKAAKAVAKNPSAAFNLGAIVRNKKT